MDLFLLNEPGVAQAISGSNPLTFTDLG